MAKLHAQVGVMLRYLIRLQARMDKLAFPPADPLYRRVSEALDKMHALSVEVHYLGCDKDKVAR